MNEEEIIEGNIDLNQALKEFEEESTTKQAPSQDPEIHQKEVSGIKFETDTYKSANNEANVPRMVGWVMKYGAIENQKIAEYILLGFAIAIFALSLYFFFGDSFKNSNLPTEAIPDPSQFVQ